MASPLFNSDEVIHITISGPFGSLLEEKPKKEYLPFVLDGDESGQTLKVRLRGHSRIRVCEFPPLRLNFPADVDQQSVFAGQDKLKLVTHCRNYDRGEQDMLEEYAAYRVLNLLTELSYRVRLLNISYDDSDGLLPEDAKKRYGFVIESKQEFEGRTGAQSVSLEGFPKSRHDLEHAALMYVFQFMIANTDWMMIKADYDEACCHNLDLFEIDSRVFLVPFDFDLAGVVNARYAYPDPQLRIKSVKQRLYRGLCTDSAYLAEALRTVNSRRGEILAIVWEIPGLETKNRERAAEFLEGFFEKAENEDRLLASFERRCIEGY